VTLVFGQKIGSWSFVLHSRRPLRLALQVFVPGDLGAELDRGRLLRTAVAAGHARLLRKEPSLPTRCLGACDPVAFALLDPRFRKLLAVLAPVSGRPWSYIPYLCCLFQGKRRIGQLREFLSHGLPMLLPTWSTKLCCASRHRGKQFSSALEPFGERVTNFCRMLERREIATKPSFFVRHKLRVSVVRSITRSCASLPMGTGANLATTTRREDCVDRTFVGFRALSKSCVTARAAFRRLKHAQDSVPCRARAWPPALFEVHIHMTAEN